MFYIHARQNLSVLKLWLLNHLNQNANAKKTSAAGDMCTVKSAVLRYTAPDFSKPALWYVFIKMCRHLQSNCILLWSAFCMCVVAEVSSPALTSLGPFLWQTFVTLWRAVRGNRLLTTSAAPSLHTATFITTQKPEGKTESNSMRSTCYDEWKTDTYIS